MSGERILLVENACKTYGAGRNEVRAIKGVTVEHRAGEVLAIFGPSGSGKTTFLMIAGLIDVPTSGRVWYRGEIIASHSMEIDELRRFRQRHIGFVFQRFFLLPQLGILLSALIAGLRCQSQANCKRLLDRDGALIGLRAEMLLPGHLHGDMEEAGSRAGEVLDGDAPITAALAELKKQVAGVAPATKAKGKG